MAWDALSASLHPRHPRGIIRNMNAAIHLRQKSKRDISREVNTALLDFHRALQEIYPEDTPKMLIYGSQARREACETSDVDVLLLYSRNIHPGVEIRRLSPVLSDLNPRYQVLISVFPATEIEYRNGNNLFWENIKKEGITINNL